MEDKNQVSTEMGLPLESEPFFEKIKVDKWDKIFAAAYLALGYVLWKSWQYDFLFNISGFVLLYIAVVSLYCFVKGFHINGEKIFWTMILLGVGVPYGYYSIMPLNQLGMLAVVGAYWTLVMTDALVSDGKTSSWVLLDIWYALIILPLSNFLCQMRVLLKSLFHKSEKKTGAMILLGIGISLPVLVIILPVLSQADAGFSQMLRKVLGNVFDGGLFLQLCIEIPIMLILSSLMFGTVYGGIYQRNIEKDLCKEHREISGEGLHIIPDVAVYTFAGIIGFTYILFIAFQAKYLFSACAGILPESFTYAEYARQGFFELCGITAFNVLLLLFMNTFTKTITRENKVLSVINIAFSAVTILLLITAMSKLGMYIAAYGFTIKRIQAGVFMIWLFLVLFMIIWHQKRKIPLVRWAVFSGAVLFTLLCILPLETMLS